MTGPLAPPPLPLDVPGAWLQGGDVTTSPSATPSPSPGADGALGTGAGVLVAIALLGLLLWSRRRLDRR